MCQSLVGSFDLGVSFFAPRTLPRPDCSEKNSTVLLPSVCRATVLICARVCRHNATPVRWLVDVPRNSLFLSSGTAALGGTVRSFGAKESRLQRAARLLGAAGNVVWRADVRRVRCVAHMKLSRTRGRLKGGCPCR